MPKLNGPHHLPLGSLKQDDGSVIVPESRRADGSVRKTIRIREGYLAPDEQRKYESPAQRRRREGPRSDNSPNGRTSVSEKDSSPAGTRSLVQGLTDLSVREPPGPALPLGAVEQDDSLVIVPESTRTDGSVRKPIRIRARYCALDEQPTYQTPAQRRRNQEKLRQTTSEAPVAAPKIQLAPNVKPSVPISNAPAEKPTVQRYRPPHVRRRDEESQARAKLDSGSSIFSKTFDS